MRLPFLMLGLGLLGVAVTPTPDDITIVSPALQTIAGIGFIIYGLGGGKK